MEIQIKIVIFTINKFITMFCKSIGKINFMTGSTEIEIHPSSIFVYEFSEDKNMIKLIVPKYEDILSMFININDFHEKFEIVDEDYFLDKINKSGIDSMLDGEKDILDRISKTI